VKVSENGLEGKAVAVTGAARGLGRAYAVEAAAQGASVVLSDVSGDLVREVARQIAADGGAASVAEGSIADWAAAEALVAQCVEDYGRIDGMINNAAVFHVAVPWEETEQAVRGIVEVNIVGSVFCAVHALRAMVKQRSGSLVNVVSGAHLGIREMGAYAATKGAIASATYAWALDAEPYGVRVNAISPVARTRMSTVWENRDEAHLDEPDPSEIAPLAAFLLSDQASGISGQVVRLDAQGLSILRQPHFPTAPVALPERTFEAVAAAFAGPLAEGSCPVGFGAETLRPTSTA
jgi:NAD(P)-dependent dehydrogenase (short-subunit alcohol dehydrogenase family)